MATKKFKHIETREGPGGSSPYVGNSRVRVSDIARLYRLIESETIVERINYSLPHLTPAEIQDALDYWNTHPNEIENEIDEEERILSTLPTGPTGG